MKILSKLLFFLIAAIILIIGYFIGTFILIGIFSIIALLSIVFVLSIVLNNLLNITKNNTVRLIIKMLFSAGISIGLLAIFWKYINEFLLQQSYYILIVSIWTFTTIVFGTLWYLLHAKFKLEVIEYISKSKNSLNSKYSRKAKLHYWDLLIMVIIPSIITYCFHLLI